jgi:hypothetical protein
MKLRTIPYGYAVQNGETVPHPGESKVIRRIFKDYLGGASLLKIAQALTAEKVEFLPGRCDWNKNRVKRILEDTRYLGTDTYPALINEDMHHRAQAVKDSNNNQLNKSEVPFRLSCPVECFCGAKMNRRHDTRRKSSQELWTCQNPERKRIVNINDDALFAGITELLNRLINDPSLIQTGSAKPDPPIAVRRLQNEVDRQLDSFNFEKEQVKAAILSLAAAKYRQADEQKIISQMMRAELEKQAPLSHFSPELFKRTVSKMLFDGNGNPVLVLKNDQNIGKESDHADGSNTNG